jgi:hypothetical protein
MDPLNRSQPALHAAARRRAQELRAQTFEDGFAAAVSVLRRAARHLAARLAQHATQPTQA